MFRHERTSKAAKKAVGVLKDDYESRRRHSLWVQAGAKAGEEGGGVEDIEDGGVMGHRCQAKKRSIKLNQTTNGEEKTDFPSPLEWRVAVWAWSTYLDCTFRRSLGAPCLLFPSPFTNMVITRESRHKSGPRGSNPFVFQLDQFSADLKQGHLLGRPPAQAYGLKRHSIAALS
ncbi:hypothetical protein B0H13DRAFT_1893863 [Mycena leptocephala]|nr:hypothetical protein B0H13DRAFT_1893863 [Mycena leptocephala]